MEDAGRLSCAEPRGHALVDALEVAGELRIGMVRRRHRHVLPVIAEIEDDEVVVGEEMLPVRQVAVDRKAVAVADEEPHAVGTAVAAHLDPGSVLQRHLEGLMGSRHFQAHRRSPVVVLSLPVFGEGRVGSCFVGIDAGFR